MIKNPHEWEWNSENVPVGSARKCRKCGAIAGTWTPGYEESISDPANPFNRIPAPTECPRKEPMGEGFKAFDDYAKGIGNEL